MNNYSSDTPNEHEADISVGVATRVASRPARREWAKNRRAIELLIETLLGEWDDVDDRLHPLILNRDFLRVQAASARRWLRGVALQELPVSRFDADRQVLPRVWRVAQEMARLAVRGTSIPALAHLAWSVDVPATAELMELPQAFKVALLAQLGLVAAGHILQKIGEEETQAENSNAARAVSTSLDDVLSFLHQAEKFEWLSLTAALSPVDSLLLLDPTGDFANMPARSRGLYRNAVAHLARQSGLSESAIAHAALKCAKETNTHIGSHLFGHGVGHILHCAGGGTLLIKPFQPVRSVRIYLVTQLVVAVSVSCALILLAAGGKSLPTIQIAALIFAASVTSTWMVNYAYQRQVRPRELPSLDFSGGVPLEARTVVAIPIILSGVDGIRLALRRLEQLYFCGRERHLSYVLLTDLHDSDVKDAAAEEEIERAIARGITELNSRYLEHQPFGVFHRRRVWSDSQGRWMGHERKRGKLQQLNKVMVGHAVSEFSLVVGAAAHVVGARYVVTLDSDTMVEQGTVRRLCEVIHHPNNRPRVHSDGSITGYGLIQPNVITLRPSAEYSWFNRLTNPAAGIDPYSQVQADLYFNLFDEGSFIGKGIYDARWLEAVGGTLVDESILSHDQVEGALARCGVARHINVFEDAPIEYREDVERRMRWVRGDWQNLMLVCFGRCVSQSGTPQTGRISALAKWKMFDNARRSLVSSATLLLLLLALVGSGFSAYVVLLLGVAAAGAPSVARWLVSVSTHLTVSSDAIHPSRLGSQFRVGAAGLALRLVLLPFEATRTLVEVAKTVWRVVMSRKNLLEWLPYGSHDVKRSGPRERIKSSYFQMWFGSASGAVVALVSGTWVGIVLATLWLLAPLIAATASAPRTHIRADLMPGDRDYLLDLARRTWSYFEDYVTERTRWLAPDNVKTGDCASLELVAGRTSGTNLGLGLLAIVSACDLGFLTVDEMFKRLYDSLQSVCRLERHRGHLFNWYDLDSGFALHPRYVSTVDSGNFLAYIIILRQAIIEYADRPDNLPCLIKALVSTARIFSSIGKSYSACHVAELVQIAETFENWEVTFDENGVLSKHSSLSSLSSRIMTLEMQSESDAGIRWARKLGECVGRLGRAVVPRADLERKYVAELVARCDELLCCDYAFAYVPEKQLFSVGFSLASGLFDDACYDMLASEARLGIYVAVANGGAPASAWWKLSRGWSAWHGGSALLSWSGSMFEYFMPELVLPTVRGSLIDSTLHSVIRVQQAHGHSRGLPWGVSEAGLSTRDENGDYCYSALGIPVLGLQPDLGVRDVVAPYATAMALLVDPVAALANFHNLERFSAHGERGFYESVEFDHHTAAPRVGHIVFEYMAHHQGMSLLAFVDVLAGSPMQRRFSSDQKMAASMALLNERIPDWAILGKCSKKSV